MTETDSHKVVAFIRAISTGGDKVASLGELDTESDLIDAAGRLGYAFSLQDWQSTVELLIYAYLEDSEDSELSMLQEPIESHSAALREWEYEVCDYEGDPTWSKEQDYRFRVDHLLEQLAYEPSIFDYCDEGQLRGKGWLPFAFGLRTESGFSNLVFSWRHIVPLLDDIEPGTG